MSRLTTEELLSLSVPERIQLAEDLWDSIVMEPESLPLSEEQRMELDRRLEEYHSDPSTGSPWTTVMERIRKRKRYANSSSSPRRKQR